MTNKIHVALIEPNNMPDWMVNIKWQNRIIAHRPTGSPNDREREDTNNQANSLQNYIFTKFFTQTGTKLLASL
jgi:hypothetical protein